MQIKFILQVTIHMIFLMLPFRILFNSKMCIVSKKWFLGTYITNHHPTSSTPLKKNYSKKKKKKKNTCDIWHVTCDMWDMLCELWHVTHDMWHMKLVEWIFPQILSSLAQTFWELWCSEDMEEKDLLVNQSINSLLTNGFVEQTRRYRVC